jgi:ribosomal protein L11 methyltransferase
VIKNQERKAMQWIEISALVDAVAVEQVEDIMQRFGQCKTATEEWESESDGSKHFVVKVYLPNHRNLKKTKYKIAEQLSTLPFQVELAERLIKPEDWFDSLKKHFGIQEIGEHLIVKPSWTSSSLPDSTRIILDLDPGAAFGTGLHPTTRLCLLNLEKHLKPGMKIFDLGTGTGILSIAAAKLGADEAFAVDTDAVAVSAARNNVRNNRVSGFVTVNRGTLSIARQKILRNTFNILLANISATVISALAGRMSAVLKPGGRAICSGVNSQGLDAILISLAIADFKIETIDRDGDWYAVVAVKTKS